MHLTVTNYFASGAGAAPSAAGAGASAAGASAAGAAAFCCWSSCFAGAAGVFLQLEQLLLQHLEPHRENARRFSIMRMRSFGSTSNAGTGSSGAATSSCCALIGGATQSERHASQQHERAQRFNKFHVPQPFTKNTSIDVATQKPQETAIKRRYNATKTRREINLSEERNRGSFVFGAFLSPVNAIEIA
jgi:hypothetical protein